MRLLFLTSICCLLYLDVVSNSEVLEVVYSRSCKDTDSLFTVDKRIEVFNVLQWLSNDYPAKTNLSTNYASKVESYFSKFRSHDAVTSLDKLISFGFSYDAPINFFLHVDEGLDNIHPSLSQEIIQRAGGINNLEYFLGTVKSFIIESDFDRFFELHSSHYNEMIDSIKGRFPVKKIIHELESFYNGNLPKCKVILSTLTKGGFGPKIIGANGQEIFATIASPIGVSELGRAIYFKEERNLRSLLWHELSHPVINPLVNKYWADLVKHKMLLDRMRSTAPAWYQNDRVLYYENIVRAVTIKMAYLYENKKSGDLQTANQIKWGFQYAKVFSDLLNLSNSTNFEIRFKVFISKLEGVESSIINNTDR